MSRSTFLFHHSFILYIFIILPTLIASKDNIEIKSIPFTAEYELQKETSSLFEIFIHHPLKSYLSISFISFNKSKLKGYASMKTNPSNKQSIFKSPSNGSNIIFIPSLYFGDLTSVYLKIDCESICHFKLEIDNINTITLEPNASLMVLSIAKEQEAIFHYYPKEYQDYDNNDLQSIDVISGAYEDFEMKAFFVNANNRIKLIDKRPWINGNSISFFPNSIHNCQECYYEIKVLLLGAYSHIFINQVSHSKMSKVRINEVVYGTLRGSDDDCYTFETVPRDRKFLLYVTLYNNPLMVKFPFSKVNQNKRIDQHSSIIFTPDYEAFCLGLIIHEEETGYSIEVIEIEDYQPFITALLNGYQMIRSHPDNTIALYHQSHYDDKITELHAYMHVTQGIVKVKSIICNDFPNCKKPDNKDKDAILPIDLGDELFFSIKIDKIHRRILGNDQNLIMVKCLDNQPCEYTIIIYTNMDALYPLLGRKIGFMNNGALLKSIHFNINDSDIKEIDINLLSRYQTTTMNISSIIITKDIYKETHSQLSQIILRNDSKTKEKNTLKHHYQIEINSPTADHFSFVIHPIYDNEQEKTITLWHNEDILLTFNKEYNRRIIRLPNVLDFKRVKVYFPLLINIKTLNCKLKVKSLSALHAELKSDSFIYFTIDEQNEPYSQMIIEAEDFDSPQETCLVYYASMPLMNDPITHHGHLLLHDNVRHQQVVGIYTSDVFYSYITMTTNTDLLIDIIHESTRSIKLDYQISYGEIFSQTVYSSRKFVIEQSKFAENCISTPNTPCLIFFQITIENKDVMLFGLNVKSTREHNSPIFLRSNKMTYDATIGKSIQYYYCHIFQNDYGAVSLTVKKGSGVLYARLLNKSSRNGHLPSKEKSFNDNYDLQYDPNTKEILFTKENTDKCIKGDPCLMYISIESLNTDNTSIMDYSIALRRDSNDKPASPILIFSNENVNGNLYGTYQHNTFAYYQYRIPYELSELLYELQCVSCSLYINYSNTIPTYLHHEQKYSNGKGSISLKPSNASPFKVITIGIACDYLDEVNYANFLFRIIPLSQRISLRYEFINSEQPFICNNLYSQSPQCIYLIPVYQYEKLHEVIVGLYRDDTMGKELINIDASDDYSSSLEIKVFSYEDYVLLFDSSSSSPKHSQYMHISKLKEKKKYVSINTHSLEHDSFIWIKLTPKTGTLYYLYIAYPNKEQMTVAPKAKKVILIYKNETKQLNFNKSDKPYIAQIKHIKGKGIIKISNDANNEDIILFDSEHDEMSIIVNEEQNVHIHSIEQELICFVKYHPKEGENLSEVKLARWNYVLFPSNAFPIMKYVPVDNEDDEVTFNFMIPKRMTLKEKKTYSKWTIKGFILNDDFITKRKADQKLKPQFNSMVNGHFDNTLSIGIVTFSSKEIKEYTTKAKKLLLMRIDQDNEDTNDYVTVLTKDIAVPSFNGTLPPYHYFYSKIHLNKQVNTYALVNHNNGTFMEIEYASCYGRSQFAFNYDIKDHYQNDTNIPIKEAKVEYGKRIVRIALDATTSLVYMHIFPDTNNHSFADYEDIHFVLRYKTYDNKESDHKELYTLSKNQKNLEWSRDDSFILKFNPLKINQDSNQSFLIDYYIRFYSRSNFKFMEEINSICLYHNPFRSKHVVKQSSDEGIIEINLANFTKGELYCNIIAKFQENNNTNEHFILYDSFHIPSDLGIKRRLKYIWIIIVFLLIILLLLLILFYLYRSIRKMQMTHEYKLIDERRKNNKSKMNRLAKNEHIRLELDNKISSLIDTE